MDIQPQTWPAGDLPTVTPRSQPSGHVAAGTHGPVLPTVSDFSSDQPVTVHATAITESAAYFDTLASSVSMIETRLWQVGDTDHPVKAGNFATADRLRGTIRSLVADWALTCHNINRVLAGTHSALQDIAARYDGTANSGNVTASQFEQVISTAMAEHPMTGSGAGNQA